METIGALEAKNRLSELLKRTEQGEIFQITRHGQPVGKLMPPDVRSDPRAIAQAVEILKGMRGMLSKMKRAEFLNLKHEGHRH